MLAMSEELHPHRDLPGVRSLFHIFIEKLFQAVGNMVVPMILQEWGPL